MQGDRTVKYVHSEALVLQADRNPAVKKRASLTHNLISSYGLLPHMQVVRPKRCNSTDLRSFHNRALVQRFQAAPVGPVPDDAALCETLEEQESFDETTALCEELGLGFDCPVWPGIMDYVCAIAGATMTACEALCKRSGSTDVILNWTGGWHHAHRDRAAGYCYVNDIVLGILVLRNRFRRVFYVDLDVHHGDGVQEAFSTTKRVFTLSFHKYECGYYPGTGAAEDCGFAGGKGYAANFPYRAGMGAENFKKYFSRITSAIHARYRPEVCVVQCGADAVVGDPLGGTNLTPQDLIGCILEILDWNLPTLLLGGGGYHFPNTSRYWTSITAAVCKRSLSPDIPDDNDDFLAYGPDYCVEIDKQNYRVDTNKLSELEETASVIEGMRLWSYQLYPDLNPYYYYYS